MNKSFWKLWLRDQLPLLITYILLTSLVALLCYLYQLPMTIFTDLLRFSLPLLIVWLIATVLIAKRRQALLARQLLRADFQPCSPVEEQLAAMLAQSQCSYRHALQTARQKQREQTDQRDLFAHEIKNHLTILRAQAEEQPQVPSKQVRAAVQQANYYLDLLLSGERLAMTNHDFHFQWLTLTKLAATIVQENAALFISKQLVPDINIPANLRLLTDQKWLHFCINQLLTNAIKYAEPGSVIKLVWQTDRLTICDTGLPISSTDQPRIFESGFTGQNGHQTTKSTGMGLYFVKQVTDQLNFSVRVFSPNDHSTVAELIFPPDNIS